MWHWITGCCCVTLGCRHVFSSLISGMGFAAWGEERESVFPFSVCGQVMEIISQLCVETEEVSFVSFIRSSIWDRVFLADQIHFLIYRFLLRNPRNKSTRWAQEWGPFMRYVVQYHPQQKRLWSGEMEEMSPASSEDFCTFRVGLSTSGAATPKSEGKNWSIGRTDGWKETNRYSYVNVCLALQFCSLTLRSVLMANSQRPLMKYSSRNYIQEDLTFLLFRQC